MKFVFAVVLVAIVPALAAPQEAPVIPFYMPLPEEWRSETIPFPLDFAPELDYEGLEELRFAPGMFDAEAQDFWTYAFVWWVPIDMEFTAESLGSDLLTYFRGLTKAVASARQIDPGEPTYAADIQRVIVSEVENPRFEGKVLTFDPFVTSKPVELNVRIELIRCESQGHVAVFFELSPQSRLSRVTPNVDRNTDSALPPTFPHLFLALFNKSVKVA